MYQPQGSYVLLETNPQPHTAISDQPITRHSEQPLQHVVYGQPQQSYLAPVINGQLVQNQMVQSYVPMQPIVQQVNSAQPRQMAYRDLEMSVINSNVKNVVFGVKSRNIFLKILLFILKVLTLGLSEALFINQITSYEVKKIRIGNRRLDYKTRNSGDIIFRCIWNWIVNILTLGLWYISGQMSKHYFAKLDQNICWGAPAKLKKKDNLADFRYHVIWEPESNCLGKIKFYGIHLGWQKEFLYAVAQFFNVSFFGLLQPFILYYYSPHFCNEAYFGTGRFAVFHPDVVEQILGKMKNITPPKNLHICPFPVLGQESNAPEHKTYLLRITFTAELCDLVLQFFKKVIFDCCTCGLFTLCCWKWYLNGYLNGATKVYIRDVDGEFGNNGGYYFVGGGVGKNSYNSMNTPFLP